MAGTTCKTVHSLTNRKVDKCCHCGRSSHREKNCKFRNAECFGCHKRGHIRAVCALVTREKKDHSRTGRQHYLAEDDDSSMSEERVEVTDRLVDGSPMFVSRPTNNISGVAPPVQLVVNVAGKDLRMELDTGATFSVIGYDTYARMWKENYDMKYTDIKLQAFGGNKVSVAGEMDVPVKYGDQKCKHMPLLVVNVTEPALFGRNWLARIKLDWHNTFTIHAPSTPKLTESEVIAKHATVFDGELGCIRGFNAKLNLMEDAEPVFRKARPVLYALKPRVEAELDKLESNGVLGKVAVSEWASPLVVVPKANQAVRLCGDYKVSVNLLLHVDQDPLPTPEDLFAKVARSNVFSKIDLSTAYLQLELAPESQKLLTVNTYRGLYEYQRMNYGVASAPAIFQEIIDKVLSGLEDTLGFLDDILIGGECDNDNLNNVDQVLGRLEEYGIKVNKFKCEFLQKSVTYLGYVIDAEGIHPCEEKVNAI